MEIREIMNPAIHVDKDQRLSYAVELFRKHDIARLPVLEEGELVGIITQRDVMEKIGHFKEDFKVSTFHVSACMTRDPFTLRPSDPAEKAVHLFCSKEISGIPVVEEKLVGIVTKMDVIRAHHYPQKVTQWCTSDYFSVSSDERVIHARVLMMENNARCLPVADETLEGVITTSDVIYGLYRFMDLVDRHQSSLVRNLSVGEVMNRHPQTITPSQGLEDAKTIMVGKNISTLLVVDEEKDIVGLLSKDEMVKVLWQ